VPRSKRGAGRGRSTKNGSGRPAANGRSGAGRNGGRIEVGDLEVADLEILLKACKSYGVSLPCYLASAQEDVARAEALVEKLGDLIERSVD
jgi:hypothetical protein